MVLLNRPTADYWCEVFRYTIGHSELTVHVFFEAEEYYLHFSNVKYFAGTFLWQGVNVETASPEQCLELAKRLRLTTEIPDELYTEIFKLYYIQLEGTQITILCSRMDLSSAPPQ